jgi:peptide/nickel transport system permease protein
VRHIVARLGQSLIVIFTVTTVSFFVIRTAPGDPFSYDASTLSEAVRAHWRHQFGYDRPVAEQFVRYVTSVAHGELGYSMSQHTTVAKALATALPNTLLLVGTALTISIGLGMIIGVVQATRRGGWFDHVASSVLLVFYSLPDFWAALMLLLLFGFLLHLLPQGYMVNPTMHDYMSRWGKVGDVAVHLILPAATLTLITIAAIARYQRTAMLEVLPSDFVRTARAKGLTERQVVWRHALRNALTPMITTLGLLFPVLLGGALFVEKVFSWPGMGALTANAIESRDYDLVTAAVIVGSVMVVIGNLAADLLHAAVDPRVRE